MDFVLEVADYLILEDVWAKLMPAPVYLVDSPNITLNQTSHLYKTTSAWTRDYFPRQIISLSVITLIGINALYFFFASLSYFFIFNHNMMRHPRFLKNQVRQEIMCSLWSFPFMTILTLPWFVGEVRGHSRLYQRPDEYGWTYFFLSIPL
jgi:Delta7-sterol 5-desaturase